MLKVSKGQVVVGEVYHRGAELRVLLFPLMHAKPVLNHYQVSLVDAYQLNLILIG